MPLPVVHRPERVHVSAACQIRRSLVQCKHCSSHLPASRLAVSSRSSSRPVARCIMPRSAEKRARCPARTSKATENRYTCAKTRADVPATGRAMRGIDKIGSHVAGTQGRFSKQQRRCINPMTTREPHFYLRCILITVHCAELACCTAYAPYVKPDR